MKCNLEVSPQQNHSLLSRKTMKWTASGSFTFFSFDWLQLIEFSFPVFSFFFARGSRIAGERVWRRAKDTEKSKKRWEKDGLLSRTDNFLKFSLFRTQLLSHTSSLTVPLTFRRRIKTAWTRVKKPQRGKSSRRIRRSGWKVGTVNVAAKENLETNTGQK